MAAQTQFIGGYTGYPSLLPAATSLQWLPTQGQPLFPSIFNPLYPRQVVNYYRGIADAVGSAGAPWYFYNPSAASYPQTVIQVSSSDVKDAGANTGAAGSSRTRRQIQLRYGSGRRGRSLNEMIEPGETGAAAPSRAKRQIQLRYRSGYGGHRRGRSLNEPVQFELDRAKRQIQLRYRSSARRRHGRSLSEPWTTA